MTGPWQEQLADYLALRRALGYRLVRPEKLLGQFLAHLERAGESRITVAVALDWAQLPENGGSNWWAYRLSAVRGFATYLHALDPVHEVPAADLLPQRPLRASPYLYGDADITALIEARLPGREDHAHRQAGGIDGQVQLAGQSSAGAPQRFPVDRECFDRFGASPFFRAPAAC